MGLITEDDLNKLSDEDLKLIIEYFKEELEYENKLKNLDPENIKERELLIAKKIGKELTSPYSKERTGLKVYNDIINSLSVFEFCKRIWADQYEALNEQFESMKSVFESQYTVLKNGNLKHEKIINQYLSDYLSKNQTMEFEMIYAISNKSIKEISQNIEKYILLIDTNSSGLSLENHSFSLVLDRLEVKYPPNLVGHLELLQSGNLQDIVNKQIEFLEKNAMKIMNSHIKALFIKYVKNFEGLPNVKIVDEITLNRQVLAVYCLLKQLNVSQIDLTKIAEFIQFIIKRDLNYSKIKDSEIYSKLRINEGSKKDIEFLENEFSKIGLIFKN